MKKAQVSFEFIVLFAIFLFVFVMLVSFYPRWIERTASTQNIAENLAKDIKVKAITASLSESDFETTVVINPRINDVNISVEIHGKPDNMLKINELRTGKTLARAFLPTINSVNEIDPGGLNLTIKKEGDSLTIERRQTS